MMNHFICFREGEVNMIKTSNYLNPMNSTYRDNKVIGVKIIGGLG